MGVLTIFSTGPYAIMCVGSKTCYEKYHKKHTKKHKKIFVELLCVGLTLGYQAYLTAAFFFNYLA